MFTSLYVQTLLTSNADLVLKESGKAHAAFVGQSIELLNSRIGRGIRQIERTQLLLDRPTRARLIRTKGQSIESDIIVDGSERFKVDHKLQQHTRRRKAVPTSLRDEVYDMEMGTDDFVLAFLEEDGMARFYNKIKSQTPPIAIFSAGRWVLKNKPKGGEFNLSFDAKFRLEKLEAKDAAATLTWVAKYQPLATNASFRPPANAYQVADFRQDLKPPVYASAAAKNLAGRVFSAYDALRQLAVDVEDRDGAVQLLVDGKRIRQSDQKVDWSYDGQTLRLTDHSGRFVFVGSVPSEKLIDTLAKSGVRLEPTFGSLLLDENPFRSLTHNAKVSVGGSMAINGKESTILNVEAKDFKTTLVVEESTGRVISIASQAKGMNSAVSTRKTIRYLPKEALQPGRLVAVQPKGYANRATL